MKKILLKQLQTMREKFLALIKKNHIRVNTTVVLLYGLALLTSESSAMTFNEPFAYVTSTKPGIFVFKMVPANKLADCRGIAYRVNSDGMLEEIWRTQGWYSYNTFLSSDGEFLVRIDEGRRDDYKPGDPIIVIYKNGREKYKYTLNELGLTYDDVKSEVRGVVMYSFIEKCNGFRSDTNDLFDVILINKNVLIINVKNGKIERICSDKR